MTPAALRPLAFGILTLVLVSCGTTPANRGQTQYLEAFAPNTVPHSALYNQDMDSYWDGDGMSGPPSIVIDLSDQKAYFYKGSSLAGVSAISSGDERHPTTTGQFKITQKSQFHKSNLYGDYVDSAGNIVVANVDVNKDKAPPGTRFEGSKMPYFMRFVGGIGMHEGFLPGYPASHGCVRMPGRMASTFYQNVENGTPVTVRH